MYCILDLHLIVKVRKLNMQHKKTICKGKKIKQSVRSSQINQRRSSNCFEIFLYEKRARLVKYQNKRWIKYMEKALGCVLSNTPLIKSNLGWLSMRSLFFLGAGSSPAIRAGLDPAARPGHWPKPVTWIQQSGTRELIHACSHSAWLIKFANREGEEGFPAAALGDEVDDAAQHFLFCLLFFWFLATPLLCSFVFFSSAWFFLCLSLCYLFVLFSLFFVPLLSPSASVLIGIQA